MNAGGIDILIPYEQIEQIELLLRSPGGKILQRLKKDITPQAVYEVELVLLQHYLDLFFYKDHYPDNLREIDRINISDVTNHSTSPPSGYRPITMSQYAKRYLTEIENKDIDYRLTLRRLGLIALASKEGIEYFKQRFPPEEKT